MFQIHIYLILIDYNNVKMTCIIYLTLTKFFICILLERYCNLFLNLTKHDVFYCENLRILCQNDIVNIMAFIYYKNKL